LIEESPAHGLSESLRWQLYDAASRLTRALNYRSLGTVEFLLDGDGQPHFIEVNPRIQVEHPVTELVTGVDLVKEQLQLAEERVLRISQEQIVLRGVAIEARILAEDPAQGFLPATGEITYLKEPGGPGIRVDSALYPGMPVTADYDSLLAKVIAWGEDRAVALQRLRRALREFRLGGVPTDLEFLLQVLESPRFIAGNIDTTYVETLRPQPPAGDPELERQIALATALAAHRRQGQTRSDPSSPAGMWRMTAWREQM